MSRVGKKPVNIPNGVEVSLTEEEIKIKGKLGELSYGLTKNVKVSVNKVESNDEDGNVQSLDAIFVEPANDTSSAIAMWGTTRSILSNMVQGVSEGFSVDLEVNGVGFKAAINGKMLTLALGFSHDIKMAIPEGIEIKCPKPTKITISGFDKQKVGQIAGELMKLRPVEPYKGKGIYKEGSYVRRKEGKKK